jgi:hypothetical protein
VLRAHQRFMRRFMRTFNYCLLSMGLNNNDIIVF